MRSFGLLSNKFYRTEAKKMRLRRFFLSAFSLTPFLCAKNPFEIRKISLLNTLSNKNSAILAKFVSKFLNAVL